MNIALKTILILAFPPYGLILLMEHLRKQVRAWSLLALMIPCLSGACLAGDEFDIRCELRDGPLGRSFVTMSATNRTDETLNNCTLSLERISGHGFVHPDTDIRFGWIEPGETVHYVFQVQGSWEYRYRGWVNWNTDVYPEYDHSGVPRWLRDDIDAAGTRLHKHNLTDIGDFSAAELEDYNLEADALNSERARILRMFRQHQLCTPADLSGT